MFPEISLFSIARESSYKYALFSVTLLKISDAKHHPMSSPAFSGAHPFFQQ